MNRYIAGNNIPKVIKASKKQLLHNKLPIINYIVEKSTHPQDIFMEYVSLIDKLDDKFKIAIKLSAFHFNENLLDCLIKKCIKKNIQIIIDAEEDKLNNQYQSLCEKFMYQYNQETPYIVKTYQMYRKDALKTFENDLEYSEKNKINLGIKLVRGAYHYKEKYDGHLFTNKKDTDKSYNNALITLSKNHNNKYILLATHNNRSINLGIIENKKAKHNIFEFGHLMGMYEKKYQYLADNGSLVNTYIPNGPYNKMFPYLSRRMYENIDMVKYMVK